MKIRSVVNIENRKINGWVMDEESPESKVKLCCIVNGKLLYQFVADLDISDYPKGFGFIIDLITILNIQKNKVSEVNSPVSIDICFLDNLLPLSDGQFHLSSGEINHYLENSNSDLTGKLENLELNIIVGSFELAVGTPRVAERKLELLFSGVPFTTILSKLSEGESDKYEFMADLTENDFQDLDLLRKELIVRDALSGAVFWYEKPLYTNIQWDCFVGRIATGWSVLDGKGEQTLNLFLGSHKLGKLSSNFPRPDVSKVLGLNFDNMGYWQDLGGLMQFCMMNGWNQKLKLSFDSQSELMVQIKPEVKEALTFSPMNLTMSGRDDKFPFVISHATYRHGGGFDIYFKNESPCANMKYHISAIQSDVNGICVQVMSNIVTSTQEVFIFRSKLFSSSAPLLILVTDVNTGAILFTDCIPIPSLMHIDMKLLVELHGLFVNWQKPMAVVRKLQRHWLEYQIKMQMITIRLAESKKLSDVIPTHLNTELIVFKRTSKEQINNSSLDALKNSLQIDKLYLVEECKSGESLTLLENHLLSQGTSKSRKETQKNIKRQLEESTTEFFILAEYGVNVRPDYWAVIYDHWDTEKKHSVLTGNYIQFDGSSRPNYVNHKPLTMNPEEKHLPVNLCLFSRKSLLKLFTELDTKSYDAIYPEHLISNLDNEYLLHLRLPLSIIHDSPFTIGESKFGITQEGPNKLLLDEQMQSMLTNDNNKLPNKVKTRQANNRQPGVSVIINFRNSGEVTNKCISSISLQNYEGPIELVLVNNDSHSSARNDIHSHAVNLFGTENVKLVDYSMTFNHSDQCNLAVSQASHPLILMLSNDAVLISRDCITRAAIILKNKNVATCGFRILRHGKEAYSVESLGLKLALGSLAAMGGRLLARNEPLISHLNFTLRVAGNTFAAAMMQKNVYLKVGGLDKSQFPTNYNDVDFSLRSSSKGYIHVSLGNCIVQHSGRGSREPDLDFPSNPKILASIGNLDECAHSYNLYGFGEVRVF